MGRTICVHGVPHGLECEDCAWDASAARHHDKRALLANLAGQAFIGLCQQYPRSSTEDLAIKATSVAFHIYGRIERMTKPQGDLT